MVEYAYDQFEKLIKRSINSHTGYPSFNLVKISIALCPSKDLSCDFPKSMLWLVGLEAVDELISTFAYWLVYVKPIRSAQNSYLYNSMQMCNDINDKRDGFIVPNLEN